MSAPGASTPADASTLGRLPDASTLTVTALNVGMHQEDSFKRTQGVLVAKLARYVQEWLDGPGAAVVGLNEIHPTIAGKLMSELRQSPQRMDVQIATSGSNSLLWCAPQ